MISSKFISSALLWHNYVLVWTCQLCDLYENDSIFDKFECCLSGDGLRVATGSYRSVIQLNPCFNCLWKCLSPCMLLFFFHLLPAIYSEYSAVLLEVPRLQHWKPVKIQWGKFIGAPTSRIVFISLSVNIVASKLTLCILSDDKFRLLQGRLDHLEIV